MLIAVIGAGNSRKSPVNWVERINNETDQRGLESDRGGAIFKHVAENTPESGRRRFHSLQAAWQALLFRARSATSLANGALA